MDTRKGLYTRKMTRGMKRSLYDRAREKTRKGEGHKECKVRVRWGRVVDWHCASHQDGKSWCEIARKKVLKVAREEKMKRRNLFHQKRRM